jgi:DNA recombination protein RmuC
MWYNYLLIALVIFSIVQLALLIFRRKNDCKDVLEQLQNAIAYSERTLKQELAFLRQELQQAQALARQEQTQNFGQLGEQLSKNLNLLAQHQKTQFGTFTSFLQSSNEAQQQQIDRLNNNNKEKLKDFENQLTKNFTHTNQQQEQQFQKLIVRQEQIKEQTEAYLEKIRQTVAQQLKELQLDNAHKLEAMRQTVDEKLHQTLEKRFNDSFTMISQRLELVHKGLGEMQNLAANVGDLKKVMSNVKSRGVIGEYQLANLLEDLLTNEQYEKNVATKPNSGAIVEFAIKMPNNSTSAKALWLPIDAKFPKEDYELLVEAYELGDNKRIEELKKQFRNAVIKNAKDIKEKYIDPPNTTEYGIMFLPFESLYAEVLRIPGLFEELQKKYKITVTGPTTLSALLSSLQMGFRTLAIEKRSSEVWDLLSAVKTEFGKFGDILEKTKKKLQEATNTIDNAGIRSRAIERKLKNVTTLPSEKKPEIATSKDIEFEENSEAADIGEID